MERRDLVLAVLATAGGEGFSPVQAQKTFFLIDKKISDLIGGPYFDFEPYNYGPFDAEVYCELERLEVDGLAEARRQARWKTYFPTARGVDRGREILETIDPRAKGYIGRVSVFVRQLTFAQLCSAVYNAYPEMRANSVFVE